MSNFFQDVENAVIGAVDPAANLNTNGNPSADVNPEVGKAANAAGNAAANSGIPGVSQVGRGVKDVQQANSDLASVGKSIGGIGKVIDVIWTNVTNWRMWASLGWIVAGLLLFLIGVGLWVNKETGGSLGSLLKLAVL